MKSDTAWVCIAAIAIVGILSLAFIFKQKSEDGSMAVKYNYDEQNRLTSMEPLTAKITLREV